MIMIMKMSVSRILCLSRFKSVSANGIQQGQKTLFFKKFEVFPQLRFLASSPPPVSSKNVCDVTSSMTHLAECVRGPTVSNITQEAAAIQLCHQYGELNTEEKHDFLKQMSLNEVPNDQREATFKRIGQIQGGVKFLVDMRKDLLDLMKKSDVSSSQEYVSLKKVNADLRNLLSNWFSVGFLNVEQVTWSSPCSLVEKICNYEAVHPIVSWTDIKLRLGDSRRVFVFTHPSMPGEPVVILHVALTPGPISDNVDALVRHPPPSPRGHGTKVKKEDCRAAIFYSVTSTQAGLQGIELGTHLIKHAVTRLMAEFPQMSTFSTLSPIPGFRTWLIMELTNNSVDHMSALTESEMNLLKSHFGGKEVFIENLVTSLKTNSWLGNQELTSVLKPILMRLCARYLYQEKRRNFALNSVANFHLRNGSCLWRINWLADSSRRGMLNSCGMMVNYRYFLDRLETNSNNYLSSHSIDADTQVLDLLK